MKILVSFAFLLIYLNCISQEVNSISPTTISALTNSTNFAPEGWTVLSKIEDDFNNDSLPDYAFILQSKDTIRDSSAIGYYQNRTLIVLFQRADNSFEKAVETSKLFGKGNWGVQSTDAFAKMLADNGRIKISFSTGGTLRAYMTYSFIYQNNNWILSQYDSEVYEWSSPDRYVTRYHFITGVQENLKMNKNKTLMKKISTIDYDLQLNGLERRVYNMTEIDASFFIDPFKGDSFTD